MPRLSTQGRGDDPESAQGGRILGRSWADSRLVMDGLTRPPDGFGGVATKGGGVPFQLPPAKV